MVSTVSTPDQSQVGVKSAVAENLLTPRFYTTDFEKAACLDLSAEEAGLKAMLAEMKADYNRHHFVRNEDFKAHLGAYPGRRTPSVCRLSRKILCVRIFRLFIVQGAVAQAERTQPPPGRDFFIDGAR